MRPAGLTLLPFALLMTALPTLAAAAGPWYLGVSAGPSSYGGDLRNPDPRIYQQTEVPGFDGTQSGLFPLNSPIFPASSGTSTGYDLFAGYRLSPHWALEAHYLDMGSADATRTVIGTSKCIGTGCAAAAVFAPEDINARTDGVMLSVVGSHPFSDSWSTFFTAGILDSRTKVVTSVASASVTDKSSKAVLAVGVGVQYTAGDWAFRLGWEQLNQVGDSSSTGTGSVNFTFLSVLCSL